jgi:hypothetical protein
VWNTPSHVILTADYINASVFCVYIYIYVRRDDVPLLRIRALLAARACS